MQYQTHADPPWDSVGWQIGRFRMTRLCCLCQTAKEAGGGLGIVCIAGTCVHSTLVSQTQYNEEGTYCTYILACGISPNLSFHPIFSLPHPPQNISEFPPHPIAFLGRPLSLPTPLVSEGVLCRNGRPAKVEKTTKCSTLAGFLSPRRPQRALGSPLSTVATT